MSAWSLGFGRVPDTVAFGQPLDLAVPLHLEPGELLPGCVKAEVTVGARRLPDEAVRAQLERAGDGTGHAHVRIRSQAAVREPLVAVRLTVGCQTSAVRQFVALADPPAHTAPTLPAAAAGAGTTAASAARHAARGAALPPVGPATTAASLRPTPVSPPDRAAAAPSAERDEPHRLLKAARQVLAEQDGQLVRMAHAASAAQAAASAADRRVAALEQDLLQMHGGAQQQRATTAQLRRALAQTADQSRLLWASAALVLTLGGCTAWLALRMRALQRERRAWRQGAGAVRVSAVRPTRTGTAAAVVRRIDSPVARGAIGMTADALRSAEPGPGADLVPARAGTDDALIPPGSIDELIDVDQQAEFFVLLGEEQAAIDLLQAHLRQRGDASPLPYLRLLEIYRGRGDREAHERTCRRFEDRFGAPAPHWGAAPALGRELQDHAAALAALQAAWSVPRHAIGELHKLLLHAPGSELLGLAAYRDVLALYAVARDLARREALQAEDVDLLLPLAPGEDGYTTASRSIFDRAGTHPDRASAPATDRREARVDLDLDEPATMKDQPLAAALPGRVI